MGDAMLGSFHILNVGVNVTMSVSMGVIVEEDQANDVGQKTKTTDNTDEFAVLHLLGFHQPLYSLEENRYAQGDQEDTIDEGTEGFGTLPLDEKLG